SSVCTACRSLLPHVLVFFFTYPRPPEIYTLSLHDALPICGGGSLRLQNGSQIGVGDEFDVLDGCRDRPRAQQRGEVGLGLVGGADRKSTRLNSSHVSISYAVFCLKKKKKNL